MTDSSKGKRNMFLACFLFFFCRLTARGVSFAYSYVSTDILYMDGALPSLLLTVRSVMTWLSVFVTVVAFCTFIKRGVEKSCAGMAWAFTLICLADATTVFLGDLLSGAFQDSLLVWLGLAVVAGTFLAEFAFIWLVYCIARNAPDPKKAILGASVLHMAGRLIMETVYLIQFLIDVDFSPYAREIWSILCSYGNIVWWQGVALWLAAMLAYRLLCPRARCAQ